MCVHAEGSVGVGIGGPAPAKEGLPARRTPDPRSCRRRYLVDTAGLSIRRRRVRSPSSAQKVVTEWATCGTIHPMDQTKDIMGRAIELGDTISYGSSGQNGGLRVARIVMIKERFNWAKRPVRTFVVEFSEELTKLFGFRTRRERSVFRTSIDADRPLLKVVP